MKNRITTSVVFDIALVCILALMIIITLYPVLNVLALSLSNSIAITTGKVYIYPIGINLNSYKYVFRDNVILNAYVYTVIYAVLGAFLSLMLTSMVAYSLSVKNYIFRRPLTVLFAITMFFGGGLIPYYVLIKNLGMIDTLWVMVIPGAVSAWNVIIYRSFFQELPISLRESAYIDGANDITILFRIILPLSKPLLATMALFAIVGKWNDFFTALIFLNKADMYPLQMVLRRLLISKEISAQDLTRMQQPEFDIIPTSLKAATIMVTIIPIMCIYPFLQKYFAKGILIGSIKG